MAELNIPRGNQGLLTLLEEAPQVAIEDRATGLNYVEQEWTNQATAFRPEYHSKVRGLVVAQQRRAQEIGERRAVVDELDIYVRDFMVVLKRRVSREKLPPHYYSFFNLPQDGTLPNPTATDAIINWAETLAQGDADAVTAGYEPMANPSAAQVAALWEQARAESADLPAAERELDIIQDEVEAMRQQATELVHDLADQLNFRLRKLEAPDRRRIIRRYGFQYRYDQGDPVDIEDTGDDNAA